MGIRHLIFVSVNLSVTIQDRLRTIYPELSYQVQLPGRQLSESRLFLRLYAPTWRAIFNLAANEHVAGDRLPKPTIQHCEQVARRPRI